jgi:hypothetical protein
VLALGGVAVWVVHRDAGSDASQIQHTDIPPVVPPPTKEPAGGEKESPQFRDLVRELQDPDLETNRVAIEELLPNLDEREAQRAIPALVDAARRQADSSFRQFTAQKLQQLGPPRKEDADWLKVALQIPNPAMRGYAVSALTTMGAEAPAAIMGVVAEALKQDDPGVRRLATWSQALLRPTWNQSSSGACSASSGYSCRDRSAARSAPA